ncbi:hypothetical protein SAMN05444398_109121 [Roseovarius pacificus]|uniref:Uncharacterized protein n=1 Tax=Roseovarius pacificus TaxID=337701 RepID=A0A1M7FUP4_9RHOB|nr:hypothetical protein SAMN05444398_109121 [Roseovarius pacificus]
MLLKDIYVFFQLMIIPRELSSFSRITVEVDWNTCPRENLLQTLAKATFGNLLSYAEGDALVRMNFKERPHHDRYSSCPLMPRISPALLGVLREKNVDMI